MRGRMMQVIHIHCSHHPHLCAFQLMLCRSIFAFWCQRQQMWCAPCLIYSFVRSAMLCCCVLDNLGNNWEASVLVVQQYACRSKKHDELVMWPLCTLSLFALLV